MAANIDFDGSACLLGGKYSFLLDCDKVTVKDLSIHADSLDGLYVVAGRLKRLVIGIIFRWLGGARDDQAIAEIRKGSLLVKLRCFTNERFMEVWGDFQSGKLKRRLQEEFSACEFEVEGLKIDIENLEEVNKTRAQNRIERIAEVPGMERRISPRIIVQGCFAGMRPNPGGSQYIEGIKEAVKGGYAVMTKEGKTAVDAVEEAVRIMENDEHFNAGVGSFANDKGDVECGAMIMDGKTMETGAVMAVQHFTNPVSLSRKVMEQTPHCALCEKGALKFAQEINEPVCDPAKLKNVARKIIGGKDTFDNALKILYGGSPVPCDSATAVAMDANGHLACATSTGGIPGKREGRIGDAPLVGCGGYANKYGAATARGHGEALMRMTLARDVVFNMENDMDAQKSAEKSIKRLQDDIQGAGSIIAIDKNGNFGIAFNIDVIWASIKDDELNGGIGDCELPTERL